MATITVSVDGTSKSVVVTISSVTHLFPAKTLLPSTKDHPA